MKKINLGVVGLDHWYYAYPLVELCKDNENVNLIAVSHDDEKRVKEFAKQHNIKKYYMDHIELINDREIDAIIVTSYTASHYKICLEAATRKKHILCNKPMALNAKGAREIENAVNKNRVRFMMCHDYRYTPCYVVAKKYIDEGTIGNLRAAVWTVRVGVPQGTPYTNGPGWYVQKAKSGGGGFIDHASHTADLLLWYFGNNGNKVKRVYAEVENLIHKQWDVEDYGIGIIKFEDGALVTVESTFTGNERSGYNESLQIIGSEGDIYISRNEKPPVRIIGNVNSIRDRVGIDVPMLSWTEGIKTILNTFVDCVIKDRKTPIGAEDGRRVLEVMDAAYKSAKEKKPVFLE